MLQVTPVDCQPTTIVKEIQLIFDAELQSKKIEMDIIEEKSYEDLGIEYVRADPSRISQILINLLSNAIKFLENRPERRITLVLGVSTTAPKLDATPLHSPDLESEFDSQDLYLLFSIHDTGPGLKKAEMAALFQRFSQATPRTHVTYGGSGLGLFISKRLVELQGGRIYVDSVEGKGSTFSFFIKVERSTMVSKQKTSPRTHATVPEADVVSDGIQTHVLVVEVCGNNLSRLTGAPQDNLINQRLLKKQLVGSGYRVSVANHGREAVDKVLASQNSPKDLIHLVLMDVEMPILNVSSVCNAADFRGFKLPGYFEKRKPRENFGSISRLLRYLMRLPFLRVGVGKCAGRAEEENV
jgi:CheY-like chemotaxis protein